MQNIKLAQLTILELSTMLSYIHLGIENIKKYLNDTQFKEMLSLGGLNESQHQAIKASQTEKSGNLVLTVNTVFTCMLGGWLGVCGFLDVELGTPKFLTFLIVFISVVSAGFGYYHFKLIEKRAKNSQDKQKLNNLELKILTEINNRQEKNLQTNTAYLIKQLVAFNQEVNFLLFPNKLEKLDLTANNNLLFCIDCLNSILAAKISTLPKELPYQIYTKELSQIKQNLGKNLASNLLLEQDFTQNAADAPKAEQEVCFIKILTNPDLASTRLLVGSPSWWRNNWRNLILGLVPTILGGFSSSFVYLSGLPTIAKIYNPQALKFSLTHVEIKFILLTVAVIITVYFAFSFVYSNLKSFKREQKFLQTRKLIGEQEARKIAISTTLNVLKKINKIARQISNNFLSLKQLEHYLHQKRLEFLTMINILSNSKI